ncbi:MAG: DUF3501 family protein [Acidimicrobiales bacterium]
MTTSGPLQLEDVADQRAYEREREQFRSEVIEVKKRRRIGVGPLVTFLFENRMTIRFQIQEMARAERMSTDQEIQHELDVYNRLLPSDGELSATLFIEMTDDAALRAWLPRLVGIEGSCVLRIGEGPDAASITSVPEVEHEAALTRDDITSAVHYVRFPVGARLAHRLRAGPAVLAIDHPGYPEGLPGTMLGDATRSELASDLVA